MLQVAFLFTAGKQPLEDICCLDTCVTIVDASQLLGNLGSTEGMQERGRSLENHDGYYTVAELMLAQIEAASTIVLSKVHSLIAGIIVSLDVPG